MSLTRSIVVAIATVFMVVAAPAAYAQVVYGQAGYGYGQAAYGYGQVGYGYGQAGCGGCGTAAYAPIVYAQPIAPAQIYVGGCNTCAEPVTPVAAPSACCAMAAPAPIVSPVVSPWVNGCGGCGVPAPAPVVSGCGGGCGGVSLPILSALTGGCGGCGVPAAPAACCGTPAVYTTPAPVYVVNQGPDFTGPGIMEPYRTYAPPAQYVPPPAYPPYAGYAPRPYYPAMHHYYPVHHYYPNMAYHPHAWAPRYYGRPYWRRMPTGS
jgi:hypothetical protein